MEYELTVIIPVFNEADNLERVKKEMSIFLNAAKKKSKVLFINDGSKDSSLSVIQEICKDNDEFTYMG